MGKKKTLKCNVAMGKQEFYPHNLMAPLFSPSPASRTKSYQIVAGYILHPK
ncbi:hypothetical protein, unlikely [Trypanosoma brucei brucei TREU927]|uniref:Uncharacterized protein n=1 Tax=Trypanosoma brucei brucei (strain 927/4 GUTat10.1) TaxID=185431 RepID=Q38FL0_TRYB2|nr:hypothetical protein, unlikely [Trypanosoma brucei brucei TREU927]EAN76410.1 hypothetical protein, unlikely [Trypanosoma brucei brucei TREU927]